MRLTAESGEEAVETAVHDRGATPRMRDWTVQRTGDGGAGWGGGRKDLRELTVTPQADTIPSRKRNRGENRQVTTHSLKAARGGQDQQGGWKGQHSEVPETWKACPGINFL